MPDPYEEPELITELDEKLDDDVDRHDPSLCFVEPAGQAATFAEPELKLEPEPYDGAELKLELEPEPYDGACAYVTLELELAVDKAGKL